MVTFVLFLFGMLIMSRALYYVDAFLAGKMDQRGLVLSLSIYAVMYIFVILALFQA